MEGRSQRTNILKEGWILKDGLKPVPLFKSLFPRILLLPLGIHFRSEHLAPCTFALLWGRLDREKDLTGS
jgi:hypothetical protein